jgi:carbamate kinase
VPRRLVVALGGHCLVRPGEPPSVAAQRRNLRRALEAVAPILVGEGPVALVHGNGPQVGHALIRSEEGLGQAYEIPLDVCVAQTQGEIGYLIQEALEDLFRRWHRERAVLTAVTRVKVARPAPGERVPRKPIGPFYPRRPHRAFPIIEEGGGRGFRRVVPSPRPVGIVGAGVLRRLYDDGVVVIAAGGGGIPSVTAPDGSSVPVEAVVDKDWAAALLALEVGATTILDLTGVDAVRVGFGTTAERPLAALGPGEARRYLAEGGFAEGSMAPKIEAALHFLEHGGAEVIIASPDRAADALEGRAGTRIAPDVGKPAPAPEEVGSAPGPPASRPATR